MLLFGALTGLALPQMEANLTTPLIGVWERICIGAYMLWVIVLAIILLRREKNAGSLTPASNEKIRKKLTGKELV